MEKVISQLEQNSGYQQSENINFFNIYTYLLRHLILRYEADITSSIPHRELHRILDQPFDHTISLLVDTLNQIEQSKILDHTGYYHYQKDNRIFFRKNENGLERLEALISNEYGRKKVFGNTWSLEEVKKGIINQINNYLDGKRKKK